MKGEEIALPALIVVPCDRLPTRIRIEWSGNPHASSCLPDRTPVVHLAERRSLGEDRRPWDVPERLLGLWEISLCVSETHAWIRFRSVETGEIHTCGRYARGFGGVKDWKTGS